MKKLFLSFSMCCFLLYSCSDKNVEVNNPQSFFRLKNTKTLTDVSIIKQLKTNVEGIAGLKSANIVLDNTEIDATTVSDYYGTDIKSVVLPVAENLSYITYLKDDILMNGGMLVNIDKCDQNYTVSFSDTDMQPIGSMEIIDGVIINPIGMNSNKILKSAASTETFLKGFTNCVGATLSKMTDGSTLGSAMGLTCLIFGPECAAGIGVSCAVFAGNYE